MDKKKMLWIGGGIAALGVLTVIYITNKNSGVATSNTTTLLAPGACPAGQVPCSNNKLKCYNPSANYVIDPCASSSIGGVANPIANPIAEIIDGVIGLFKKKPAAPTTPIV